MASASVWVIFRGLLFVGFEDFSQTRPGFRSKVGKVQFGKTLVPFAENAPGRPMVEYDGSLPVDGDNALLGVIEKP